MHAYLISKDCTPNKSKHFKKETIRPKNCLYGNYDNKLLVSFYSFSQQMQSSIKKLLHKTKAIIKKKRIGLQPLLIW